MPQSDAEREAAIRDCNRLYRDPEYAEAEVPVLLRQLDATQAEIAELTRELKALRQEFADVDGACDEAEARVAELEAMVQSVGHPADDAATVNYLEVVRLREVVIERDERLDAARAEIAELKYLATRMEEARVKLPDWE